MTKSDIQSELKQDLNNINSQAKALLQQYVERYPMYKTFPQYDEYESLFFMVKNRINKNDNQFNQLHIKIQDILEGGENKLHKYDSKITALENNNNTLEKKVNFLKNNNNASKELTSEFKQIFDLDLIYTLGLGSSIVLLGFLIGKTMQEKHIGLTGNLGSIIK